MKSKWMLVGLLALLPALSQAHKEEKEAAWMGSVAASKKASPQEMAALAKLSLETAMRNALKAVPGVVLKAEIEVENGSLIYSFDILGKDKKLMEVIVDAGDGKVLVAAEDHEEGDEKGGDEKDGEDEDGDND